MRFSQPPKSCDTYAKIHIRYPQITCLHAGVRHKALHLMATAQDEQGLELRAGGILVTGAAASGSTIKGVTNQELPTAHGFQFVDIKKINIEGSEIEGFSQDADHWISRTNVIAIETHERFRVGCDEVVKKALDLEKFDHSLNQETHIFMRKKLLAT